MLLWFMQHPTSVRRSPLVLSPQAPAWEEYSHRRKYGFHVHAYALMPDHYHILLWLPPPDRLADFLRDLKSLVGRQILNWMRRENLSRLLARFEMKRALRRPKDTRYCVLQYGSYVKPLQGSKLLWQKLDYIHANPVQAGLASLPEAYPFSSARVYAGKGSTLVKVDLLG